MTGLRFAIATAWLALACLCITGARAEVLITAEEAKAADAADVAITTRGITRGPGIEQEAPEPGQSAASPLTLKIKFQPRNNVPIDLATVRLLYVKAKPVDLTERIVKHVTPDGIVLDQAEIPAGVHVLRLELKDAQGRAGIAIIKLKVADR
jgi:hypothetical protein